MADQSHAVENMVGFITAEAKEKANEIEREAQETYTIEKQRLIESEKKKIKAEFERKEKQVAIEKRIRQSNLAKDQRLRVLKERDALMKKMMETAREKLIALTKSPQYPEVLVNLIAQGVVEMKTYNKSALIMGLARDRAAIQAALPAAGAKIKAATGKDVTLTLSSENLPDDNIGGVFVLSENSKIKVINTFKSREENICIDLLPRFRKLLFN
jgi:V-type H+-transporting ATPase subunit E|eukprot:TRINITY_DN1348_c0_g1_i1.p2 TRINITY_DN1348_c0_g1~~TRINITY_DN1348_c0_g1_i1.p2  ORF type:complete len:214 (+),score=65.92 TRINITY_DN1348_c0_g1_i1:28-669(+)